MVSGNGRAQRVSAAVLALFPLNNSAVLTNLHFRAVNLNGTHRLLHLSVSDEVRFAL